MTSSRLSCSLSHAWIFWDRHRLVIHFEGYTWSSWHSFQGDSGKEWRFFWKEISLFRPPLHRRWASRPPSRLLHRPAAPRLAFLGRPSAPWPGVPAPRIPLSARPDLMQGPGVLLPPGCPPLQNVPRSGGLRLGLGRRAPLWVLGVRRPMPTVANGFVIRRRGDGVGRRRLGGGPDNVRGGISVAVLLDVNFACCASASFYYRVPTVISETWI